MLHKHVVEEEGETKSIRNDTFGKVKRSESRQICRFYTKRIGIGEVDRVKRAVFQDGQISFRKLRFRRPSVGEVRVHFLERCLPDFIAVRIDSETHVTAD